MDVNRITQQTSYQKTRDVNHARGKHRSQNRADGDFYESLSGNLYGQGMAEQEENENNGVQKQNQNASERSQTVHTNYQYYGMASAIQLQANGRIDAKAVAECRARDISYAESDYVKICVEQGFTFKAQVDVTAHTIYVEQKYEDGTVKGYDVDFGKLGEESQDPIEQVAMEAWKLVKRKLMGENAFHEIQPEEALASFYDFIQDRIENGPPKYLIGLQEYSTEEWDKLLEGVDGQLEDIREAIKEWIEQNKEQAKKQEQEQEIEQSHEDRQQTEEEIRTMEELIWTLCREE